MRNLGFLLFVVGCEPFEEGWSVDAFAPEVSEEAFPGARTDGEGYAVFQLPDGEVTVPFLAQNGFAVEGGDAILGRVDELMQRGAAMSSDERRWPCEDGGVRVPYAFDTDLTATARANFESAVEHWESETPVRFVEDPAATERLHVVDGLGCSSFVGHYGGVQRLTLGARCTVHSAIHEIGHAVGLMHEQARTDRDEHVVVHWDNIEAGKGQWFKTYEESGQSGMTVGDYDASSVMQYASWSFKKPGSVCSVSDASGCTITHLDGTYISEQPAGRLAPSDVEAVQALYRHCADVPTDDHGPTMTSATEVTTGTSIEGHIDPEDLDMFRVEVAAPGTLTAFTRGSTDTYGLLRDSSGSTLSSNDDTTGVQMQVSAPVQPGVYFILVRGFSETTTGPYQLQVDFD